MIEETKCIEFCALFIKQLNTIFKFFQEIRILYGNVNVYSIILLIVEDIGKF